VSNQLKLKPLSQKTSVALLDLPAKCRASPLRNVRIIDLLKVEKTCLRDPGKIRTSVGGDRREQTIAFTIAILVAATSANTSSSNRDCNGVSERTISIRKEPQATPLSSESISVGRIKSQSGTRLTQPLRTGDVIGRCHIGQDIGDKPIWLGEHPKALIFRLRAESAPPVTKLARGHRLASSCKVSIAFGSPFRSKINALMSAPADWAVAPPCSARRAGR
jgi:hypothetical protein